MPDFLEVTVDKFTFKVANDRLYSREGVWVQPSPLTPLPKGERKTKEVNMVELPQKKVGIVACSGEELAEGTVTRLAALKVLEQLRPSETVTICLPLFLAGGEGDRALYWNANTQRSARRIGWTG